MKIVVFQKSTHVFLGLCLIPEREHKSLEEKFPLVELTFPVPFQISLVELFIVCSVCL